MTALAQPKPQTRVLLRHVAKNHPGTDDSIFSSYVKQLRQIPVLSRTDELALAIKAQGGDETARNKLVTSNLRFVASVARKYHHHGLSIMDLINDGNMGLMHAAKKFDPTTGFRFITYAASWIKDAMLTAIHQKSSLIHIPRNRLIELKQFNDLASEPENFQPDALALPRHKGPGPGYRHLEHLANISRDQLSLNAPIGSEGDLSLEDICPDANNPAPESRMDEEDLRRGINQSLARLSTCERKVVEGRFGLNGRSALTLETLSREIGLSKERIRQIEKKAILKLRANRSTRNLLAYLN